MKCVYVFELSDGTVKVGITRDVQQRAQQVATTRKVDVLNVYNTEFFERRVAYVIEQNCHNALRDKVTHGEFFSVTFNEACAVLRRCAAKAEDISIKHKICSSLISARRFKNLSERKFSVQADILPVTLHTYEAGKQLPSVIDIVKIAKAHDISADYLLGLINKPHAINVDVKTVADKETIRKMEDLRIALRSILY